MATGESVPDTGSRLDKLKWALGITEASIEQADADKRSPLIGQYRALLAEIAEIEGPGAEAPKEVNGLVILQEELAKRRQSGATPSRSASRRLV